ncbi:MAG: PAS domain-containing protein [Candidatus Thiodiazotropha sp.]|jgi:PAS domain S-box-containing protein
MSAMHDSGREVSISQREFMVTKSDLNGDLIYANRAFMQINGYPESELLGKPLGMFHHPDMPKGIFQLLSASLDAERECFLYLKNRTREGDFYWAYTIVNIIRDDSGRAKSHLSVLRRPSPASIGKIARLYGEMRRIEGGNGSAGSPKASLQWLMEYVDGKGHSYDSFIHTLTDGAPV